MGKSCVFKGLPWLFWTLGYLGLLIDKEISGHTERPLYSQFLLCLMKKYVLSPRHSPFLPPTDLNLDQQGKDQTLSIACNGLKGTIPASGHCLLGAAGNALSGHFEIF